MSEILMTHEEQIEFAKRYIANSLYGRGSKCDTFPLEVVEPADIHRQEADIQPSD